MAEGTAPLLKALDAFTLFPKLPADLQLKIWKHAVPDPRVMQVHSIYPISTRSPSFFQQQRCDAEAATPGHDVQFGTDIIPSGLLRACKQSRSVILKIHNGCIESGHRKVRFDKENDVIFLNTISQCCERGLPGLHSRPETLPDYRKIFVGVHHLALSGYALTTMLNDRLHFSTEDITVDQGRESLISSFRSLQKLYLVCNKWTDMRRENGTGEILLHIWEESFASRTLCVDSFVQVQKVISHREEYVMNTLNKYKQKEKLDDWKVPLVKLVEATKAVSLGGGDRWERHWDRQRTWESKQTTRQISQSALRH